MLHDWSLKSSKSLSIKLNHFYMHRCYTVAVFWPKAIFLTRPKFYLNNSSCSGIKEKVRGGEGKCCIPTYTLKGLTLFRMGCQKDLPAIFSPITPRNIGISPQNFLTFNFNHFAMLVQYLKAIPSASPKSLNLNQDQSSIKVFKSI